MQQRERHARSGALKGRRDRLGPAEYALLGMMSVLEATALSGQGVHGYDLGKRLNDGPLAGIIRIEPGMLYHYLKKLAKAELITTVVEHQATRPDRQDHLLTDTGRATLRAWLAEPVRATREMRLEFLVKLTFARELDSALARELVLQQREIIANLVRSLQGQLDAVPGNDADADMRRTVLQLRQAQTTAVLGWLDQLPETT